VVIAIPPSNFALAYIPETRATLPQLSYGADPFRWVEEI
jgi:hypothetical protein